MADSTWELFATFGDIGSAQVLAAKLESEGIPTSITPVTIDSALKGKYQVYVDAELAHRARWVTSQLGVSDAELEYMATGNLPDSEE